MLVLSRRVGEEIVINDNVRVTVVAVKGDRVRLGIVAPKDVHVDRAEIHQRRMEFDVVTVPSSGECDESVMLGALPTSSPHDTKRHY